jgi:hypothetical protein
MNFFGLAVFIITYLVVAILILKIFENLAANGNNIGRIRKSINTIIGPNARGILKVVLVFAFIIIEIKLDFQYAFVFGIFGGVTIGLMAYFFDPKVRKTVANKS